MYIVVGLLISLAAIHECSLRERKSILFIPFTVFLTLLLCFRYGQGTDYFGYYAHYSSINTNSNLLNNTLYHGELGWYILMLLSKRIGLSFEIFVACLSAVMMYFTTKGICAYSPKKMLSLLLLYPTFYLTYYYSGLRQGLVLSIFLGIGISYLIEKDYVKYYAFAVVAVLFHTASIILLLIPCAIWLEKKTPHALLIITIFLTIMGYAGLFTFVAGLFGRQFGASISIAAISLRIILFSFISFLHGTYADENSETINLLYIVYKFGFYIFLMLSFNALVSQRITMSLKAVEILLFPMLVSLTQSKDRQKYIRIKPVFFTFRNAKIMSIVIAVVLMLSVETIKNINAYLDQGHYYDWVTPLKYPYISIFDKDKITTYRPLYYNVNTSS